MQRPGNPVAPAKCWRGPIRRNARSGLRRTPKCSKQAVKALSGHEPRPICWASYHRTPAQPMLLPEDFHCPTMCTNGCAALRSPGQLVTATATSTPFKELIDRFHRCRKPIKTLIDCHCLAPGRPRTGYPENRRQRSGYSTYFLSKTQLIDPMKIIGLIQNKRNYKLAGQDKLQGGKRPAWTWRCVVRG